VTLPRTVLEVTGVPISLTVVGEGRPLLAIHGWSADQEYLQADLEPCFQGRTDEWCRVYPDLPGHGRTPAPDWLHSSDQLLALLVELCDATFGDSPFAVAGNSYGGYLTLGLVRTLAPRLLGAALLVPDLPDAQGHRTPEPPGPVIEDRAVFHDLADDEAWIPESLVVHERESLEQLRAFDLPAYRRSDPDALARLEASYLLTGRAGRPGPPFRRPSLVAAGRQDSTVGFRAALRLADELPRASIAAVDLAGHHLGRVERPAVFAALVTDWLARMEGDAGAG
jgi:pimeloyl-ACP methyl ester carboxylesterase